MKSNESPFIIKVLAELEGNDKKLFLIEFIDSIFSAIDEPIGLVGGDHLYTFNGNSYIVEKLKPLVDLLKKAFNFYHDFFRNSQLDAKDVSFPLNEKYVLDVIRIFQIANEILQSAQNGGCRVNFLFRLRLALQILTYGEMDTNILNNIEKLQLGMIGKQLSEDKMEKILNFIRNPQQCINQLESSLFQFEFDCDIYGEPYCENKLDWHEIACKKFSTLVEKYPRVNHLHLVNVKKKYLLQCDEDNEKLIDSYFKPIFGVLELKRLFNPANSPSEMISSGAKLCSGNLSL